MANLLNTRRLKKTPLWRGQVEVCLDEIQHREPKPLRLIDEQIPIELERICLKYLSKDVKERYSVASDIADELRRPIDGKRQAIRSASTAAWVCAGIAIAISAVWGIGHFRRTSTARPPSDQKQVAPSATDQVIVSNDLPEARPVITDVSVAKNTLANGGNFKITVKVSSIAPVDGFEYSLNGPTRQLLGGGSGVTFIETSPGEWQYTSSYNISEWAPSGRYYYSRLLVKNAAQQISDEWPEEPSVIIT